MQDERTTTVAVDIDDLMQLAYFAAQGILTESEDADLESMDNEVSLRDELGHMLAMAFGYGNQAADAFGADALPYAQGEILDALSGKLTARPVHAA